jgi:hypothetical protein
MRDSSGVRDEEDSRMHPSFEQFVSALRDPSQRAAIGLTISDADAASLLTRQEWATDYYHQWLAMFPAAATPVAAAESAVAQPPAPADFGPPPQSGPPQFSATPIDAPTTQLGSPARMPSRLKGLLIIGGSVVGAAVLVAVGIGVYSGVMAGSTSHRPVAGSSTSASASASAAPLPADLHGLSARAYPLMEAVFESEDRTIPEMVAAGMSDDRLRSLADTVVPEADTACKVAAKLPKGFDDPSYRSSFIAGYISTSKVSSDKASKVFDAIADYCAAG